jgi:hypothetical protein
VLVVVVEHVLSLVSRIGGRVVLLTTVGRHRSELGGDADQKTSGKTGRVTGNGTCGCEKGRQTEGCEPEDNCGEGF